MTEQEAIEQIQEHINSGKMLALGSLMLLVTPHTIPRFYWTDRENNMVWVNQRATLIGAPLSRDAIMDSYPACFAGREPDMPFYYEVVID